MMGLILKSVTSLYNAVSNVGERGSEADAGWWTCRGYSLLEARLVLIVSNRWTSPS